MRNVFKFPLYEGKLIVETVENWLEAIETNETGKLTRMV